MSLVTLRSIIRSRAWPEGRSMGHRSPPHLRLRGLRDVEGKRGARLVPVPVNRDVVIAEPREHQVRKGEGSLYRDATARGYGVKLFGGRCGDIAVRTRDFLSVWVEQVDV